MNKNLLIGIGVIVILLVGYMLFTNRQQPVAPQTETTTEEVPNATSEVMVTLSEQNASGESGTATLIEVDGKVKVTLKLGAPVGVTQPAHIHVGACPDVGAVKYPLTSPVDGMSETTLDITLAELKAGLPLGINIHKSTQKKTL